MSEDVHIYLRRAEVFITQKEYSKAIDQYLEVLKKDKNNLLASRQAGILYRQTGESGRAIPFLEKALELDMNDCEMPVLLGDIHFEAGNQEMARGFYTEALEKGVRLSGVYFNLGCIEAESGDYDLAEGYFHQSVLLAETDFNRIDRMNRIGILYQSLGEYDKAYSYYIRILEIDEKSDFACYNLSMIESARGDEEKAVDYLKQAVRINPANAYAWNNLGNWHYAAGRYEEAGEHYRRAIEGDGGFALAWYNLGNVETAKGNREKANEHYLKALELDPACEPARAMLKGGVAAVIRRIIVTTVGWGMLGVSLWACAVVVVYAPVWVGVFAAVFAVIRAISAKGAREIAFDSILGAFTGWWLCGTGWALLRGLYQSGWALTPWMIFGFAGAGAGFLAVLADMVRPGLLAKMKTAFRRYILPRTVNRMLDMIG